MLFSRQYDCLFPDADPRGRADVLLLTGLHEEMHWVHRTTGVDSETILHQGTRYLRGDFRMAMTEAGDLGKQIQDGFAQPLPENTRTRIHTGSMACGPYVVKDPAYMETLRSRESSLLGFDMESYGVALGAGMCGRSFRPVVPVVVKGVFDFADFSKGDDWHDDGGYASASFAMAILRETMSRDGAFAELKGSPSP